MGLFMATTECDWSRGTSLGAGATIIVERPITWRFRSAETLVGGGTTTVLLSPGVACNSRKVSGGGAMMAFFESEGGVREAFRPSEGGGPGMGFNASKFATGERDTGSLRLGASTTLSLAEFPRATRRVWE